MPRTGSGPQNKGKSKLRFPDEKYAAARIMYESNPSLAVKVVAAKCGLSTRAMFSRMEQDKKNGNPWNRQLGFEMSEDAKALADLYMVTISDYGPDLTPAKKQELIRNLSKEEALMLRADLLERHRRDWEVVREMMRRSFADGKSWEEDHECKKAKIYAEALRVMQDGERKAWGIDKASEGASANITVVIERE